ncbi:MAG: helix-hairpin-helix domain-containing protein, partial [Bacteroidales bacterium]|nr:helix-hairpin-helix domain-containing protein [Bacteroidales bacterium]
MPNWKQQLKEYLSFSKTERNGIVVLFGLLFILIIINFSLPYLIIDDKTDFQEFEREIANFEARQKQFGDSLSKMFDFTNIDESVAEQKIKPFPFDPNGLPVEKWKKLGLNEWQIQVIKNYENKGGRFYKNQDLKKIYSISDAEYELLEPFIEIELNKGQTTKYEKEVIAINPFSFDPNKLPEEKWLEMGLRENLVHTIINYRDKGGRFYENEDLKKIFGMKEQEYLILEPYIRIEK